MKKLILITMMIPFSSLSLLATSTNGIEDLGKLECTYLGIETSAEVVNPFSRSDRPNRFCHMKN